MSDEERAQREPECWCGGDHCARCRPPQDSVNHPGHYTFGKLEVITVIEDWGLGFHRGNALKYLARAGRKDPTKTVEDLAKAIWYIEREMAQLGGK